MSHGSKKILFLIFISAAAFKVSLAGLFRQRRNLVTLSVLFAYMIPVSLIHAVACIDTRHRWTIEPVLLILVSAGACYLFAKYFKRSVGHGG